MTLQIEPRTPDDDRQIGALLDAAVGGPDTPYGGPACQGLEPQPGALARAAGHIRYTAPFADSG